MTDDALDPLIHVPARLRIVATLAVLPDGDALSFTFSGTASRDQLTGALDMGEYLTAGWTATRRAAGRTVR